MNELNWCEIDVAALQGNLRQLRELVGRGPKLAPAVKANAYGHGLRLCAEAFVDAGADWLGVNALFEARRLRELGIELPIYVMGYVPPADVAEALRLD